MKKIILTAEHLPGVLNTIADRESRIFLDRSNWKLSQTIFQQINKIWGTLEVDLFADRLNAQTCKYISWKPDPYAITVDALTINWAPIRGYAFPPFCMIARCLAKVLRDVADLIIITPHWPAQPWFAQALMMSADFPVLLPPVEDLLLSPQGEKHPLVQSNHLTLIAWKVSGNVSKQKGFLEMLPLSSLNRDDRERSWLTEAPGRSGVAGLVKGRLIHFKPLWEI